MSSQELALILIVRIFSESKRRARKMPNRCSVGGCSNTPSLAEGIALHSTNAVPGMTSLGTRLQVTRPWQLTLINGSVKIHNFRGVHRAQALELN